MIDSNIDNNSEELIVKLSGIDWFSMKVVLQEDNLRIEYYEADTSEPTLEPPLNLRNTKILDLVDITGHARQTDHSAPFAIMVP